MSFGFSPVLRCTTGRLGVAFLCRNAVGVAYPAYMSFKALETKDDPEDDKQWYDGVCRV